MRLLAFLLPALLVTVLLAGCSDDNESKATTCQDVPSDVKTIEIHVGTHSDGSMYLTGTPGLNANQNDKVRFKVVNDDKAVFHDVALKDYAGQTYEHEVDGGATVCTQKEGQQYFVATAKGTFQIYCEQPGHKAAGMGSTFTVT